MAVQRVDVAAVLEIPDFDHIVHGPADAAVALVVEHDAVDFGSVALQAVDGFAGGDLPDAHGRIVASADESIAVGGNGTDGIAVTGEQAYKERIFLVREVWTRLDKGGVVQGRETPDAAR